MKSKTTFTKKDLVVVLICIAFLIANIAAVGQIGRKRAQDALCLSNLMKWGQIFQAYTADNDGFFHSRLIGAASPLWPHIYKPYYDDKMMRFCPTATNPTLFTGPFGTWNYSFGSFFPTPDWTIPEEREYDPFDEKDYVDGYFTGSYGMNRHIENIRGGGGYGLAFWRRVGLTGAAQAPVLIDSQYLYFWANDAAASPPAYDGDYDNEMQLQCINRHAGYVNAVFLDFSARKVGLKELWTLKYSRTFDTCGPWTICGFGGNKQACAAAWDAAAPWMRDFPEY
jgi:prepilin-type processing-associated H-X9-DG protein